MGETMIEIRFHGRGGQGAVIASTLLAEAAFREGNDVQAYPYFGVERRGAPVTAFTKIDQRPIRIKSQIYEPDHVIVLDASLLKAIDVTQGLKKGGTVLINSNLNIDELHEMIKVDCKIAAVDATKIALKHRLGSKESPIVNTAILGGFAKALDIVKLESILESIKEKVPAKIEENIKAAQDAFKEVIFE